MAAVGNYEVVENDLGALTSGSYSETVDAPEGKVVLGGGLQADPGSVSVNASYPSSDGASWTVEFVTNNGTSSAILRATCAEMGE
jgi:hypothetical protein